MTPADQPLQRSRLVERSPIYFGWPVLAVATLGMMMTTPGQTEGVSVFLDGIIADLDMSRSEVSTLYLIGTLAGSLVLPFVGSFADRRGPRLAVIVISSLFALACVWMGFVQGTVTLLLGFTLVRALGQGSLSLISVHAVAIWFVRRRGVGVMGAVANLGTGVLITRVPPRFLLARPDAHPRHRSGTLAGRLSGGAAMWIFGGMMGLRNGMYLSLEGNVFALYFVRRHIGAIRGQVATAMVIGSAIGPLVFAFGHDLTGTYAPVMLLATVPAFALGAVAPFLPLRTGGRVR